MAPSHHVPRLVRVANLLIMTLLRAGVKLNGLSHYPLYLLTVPGRTSGLPRTVPIVVWEHDEQRYIGSVYGIVDWVRNLRVAGEAKLTRGRHSETVHGSELPQAEAARVLRADILRGNPLARSYGVTANSSPEAFAQAVLTHPIFVLTKK